MEVTREYLVFRAADLIATYTHPKTTNETRIAMSNRWWELVHLARYIHEPWPKSIDWYIKELERLAHGTKPE